MLLDVLWLLLTAGTVPPMHSLFRFTRSELRKFFGARHEGMVAAYEDTLARGQVPRLPPVQAEEEGERAARPLASPTSCRGACSPFLSLCTSAACMGWDALV